MPIVDIGGTNVEFPDDFNEQQLQAAVTSAAEQLGVIPKKKKQTFGENFSEISSRYKDSVNFKTSPMGMLESVPEIARRGAEKAGQFATETFSKPDIRKNLITGKIRDFGSMNPKSAAAIGTGISMAPDIFMLSAQPTVRGKLPKSLEKPLEQVEQLSGAAPGSMKMAYEDPSIIGAPGKKAASNSYETAKQFAGGIRDKFMKITDKREFVDEIYEAAQKGEATAAEALEARKVLGELRKRIPDVVYRKMHKLLDDISKPVFEGADNAYKRGVIADSLSTWFPQNKYGGASSFKLGIMTALENLGIPGKGLGAIMSPFVSGRIASGAGSIVSQIPRMAITSSALDRLAKKRKKG